MNIIKEYKKWPFAHDSSVADAPSSSLCEFGAYNTRLSGSLRYARLMRGLKREETAQTFLDGWFVFYDFLRPHQSLNGNTPAKISGVNIEVENWKYIIQYKRQPNSKLLILNKLGR